MKKVVQLKKGQETMNQCQMHFPLFLTKHTDDDDDLLTVVLLEDLLLLFVCCHYLPHWHYLLRFKTFSTTFPLLSFPSLIFFNSLVSFSLLSFLFLFSPSFDTITMIQIVTAVKKKKKEKREKNFYHKQLLSKWYLHCLSFTNLSDCLSQL